MDYIPCLTSLGEKAYVDYGKIDALIEKENGNCLVKCAGDWFISEYKTAEEVISNWRRFK